jgi:translation initiation factor 2B subunit (eIF-2B alpha/beta/delta family)
VEKSLLQRAAGIAGHRDAGAGELLAELLPLLGDALARGSDATLAVARVVCLGQPAMASLWNACAAAVAERAHPGRFRRVRAEMERAPAALQRAGSLALLEALDGAASPQVLTLSYSSSVARVLGETAAECPLHVTCGEARPRYEGRRMAAQLASAGALVTLTTDAALTTHLDAATCVVVGADAFGSSHWTNKVGTRGLAAAAHLAGVPVFVVCARDKARANREASSHIGGPPAEVWEATPPGVAVVNPYFEDTPVELATLFLMETGRVGPAELDQVTERYAGDISFLINTIGL